MLEGEYCSMFEIYKSTPSLVPHPYGCGQFRYGNDDLSFLLTDFIDMDTRLPDPVKLSECITTLQQQSQSPTGEFGFFTTTCHGKIPQQVSWDSSWTSFYAKLLQGALQQDLEHNGSWPHYEKVASRTLLKVVPRLLGALESDGRSVKPVLTHGDLWEGNIAMEKGTGKTLLIDAAAYYAHHEMEIGMWRCQRHAIHDPKFRDAYLDQMPKDEPKDEWDDRNRLYCVKMNVIHSAHHDHVEERKTYDGPPPSPKTVQISGKMNVQLTFSGQSVRRHVLPRRQICAVHSKYTGTGGPERMAAAGCGRSQVPLNHGVVVDECTRSAVPTGAYLLLQSDLGKMWLAYSIVVDLSPGQGFFEMSL
ncbi:MAG: hypothetical protein L6R37_005582 [Teloschistes peruensis]|nr:MAG: hypothetical protein L6R37_005582 [Teloschistes peruensis]